MTPKTEHPPLLLLTYSGRNWQFKEWLQNVLRPMAVSNEQTKQRLGIPSRFDGRVGLS
jgi:hypothetical protein